MKEKMCRRCHSEYFLWGGAEKGTGTSISDEDKNIRSFREL